MAKKTQYSKIKIKRSSVAGVIPTMGPTNDHTDGSWNGTDIYPGEFFINLADNRVWFGSLSGPTEIVVPGTFGAQAITYSDLSTLKTAGGLTPGQLYIITDRGDQGIIISAIDDSNLSIIGTRIMNCPAATFYTVAGINLGVWYSGLTPTAGDKVVWGGKVWTNNAGSVGTATNDTTLSADWTVVAKPSYGASNASYDTLIFDIKYDFDNDWISEQSDDRGNIFGTFFGNPNYSSLNPVDISDWNDSNIIANICTGVWNNITTTVSKIWGNKNFGHISNNRCTGRSANIRSNSNDGNISSNSNLGAISYNSNAGDITGNTNTGLISLNSNDGDITSNSNTTLGSIIRNSNTGDISLNSNDGIINYNSNAGAITSNSNIGIIDGNANNGGIFSNTSTVTDITKNSNIGSINSNSNTGIISSNANLGVISLNANIGDIVYNSNNGFISNNTSTVTNITNNINNGDINASAIVGNITDTIVNK